MHGKGTYTSPDGTAFEGTRGKGKREGKRKIIFPKGMVHVDDCKSNIMYSRRKWIHPVGMNGFAGGVAIKIFCSGTVYWWLFQAGTMHVPGILILANCLVYEGDGCAAWLQPWSLRRT